MKNKDSILSAVKESIKVNKPIKKDESKDLEEVTERLTAPFIQEIKGFLFGRLFLDIFIEISSIGFGILQSRLFFEFK